MKSPRAAACFWVLAIAGLAATDVALAAGEADGDTLSEVVRDHVPARVGIPALAALFGWLIPHLYYRREF